MTMPTKTDPTNKKLSIAAINSGTAASMEIDSQLKSDVQKSKIDAFTKLAKATLARNNSVTLIMVKH